jgi:lipoprotein NlpD
MISLQAPTPMSSGSRPRAAVLALLFVMALVAGCAQRGGVRAPVEDRSTAKPTPTSSAPPASSPAATSATTGTATEATAPSNKPLPGAENLGKPGYYAVKPGDTLIRIGLDNGQNWRDVARWNGLDNPNVIEVGQVLRVAPPAQDPNAVATTKPVVPPPKADAKPLDPKANPATAGTPGAPGAPVAGAAPVAAVAVAPPATTSASAGREGDDDLNWLWPASGPVVGSFDEVKNKGVDIIGKAGDPVYAAADGRVIYAGGGVRGYGNLIILKHNNTYLTAYSHNQTLLVKEEQAVRRGQKIAEMGSTDADRVQLHFEIRRQGKPVDPTKLLPAR